MAFIKNSKKRVGKVISINLSRKKGTSKTPVNQARLIEEFGLEEDVHAGVDESKQVSLLSIESIRKMKACSKVKRSGMKLGPGDFAENITTTGIDLSGLKTGDRLKIGHDIMLEISKIGKECHTYCEIFKKIGTCIMPKEGIFGRVIKGGIINIGDIIEVIDD